MTKDGHGLGLTGHGGSYNMAGNLLVRVEQDRGSSAAKWSFGVPGFPAIFRGTNRRCVVRSAYGRHMAI